MYAKKKIIVKMHAKNLHCAQNCKYKIHGCIHNQYCDEGKNDKSETTVENPLCKIESVLSAYRGIEKNNAIMWLMKSVFPLHAIFVALHSINVSWTHIEQNKKKEKKLTNELASTRTRHTHTHIQTKPIAFILIYSLRLCTVSCWYLRKMTSFSLFRRIHFFHASTYWRIRQQQQQQKRSTF